MFSWVLRQADRGGLLFDAGLIVVAILSAGWSPLLPCAAAAAVTTRRLLEADFCEHRLPNRLVAVIGLGAWTGECVAAVQGGATMDRLLVVGVCCAALLFLNLTGGLGMGDVKLGTALAMGLAVHGTDRVFAFFAGAFVLGAIAAAVLLVRRGITLGGRIPFGPALLASYWGVVVAAG